MSKTPVCGVFLSGQSNNGIANNGIAAVSDREFQRVYSWVASSWPVNQIPELNAQYGSLRLLARRTIHHACWEIHNAVSYLNYITDCRTRRGLLSEQDITMKRPPQCILLAAYNYRDCAGSEWTSPFPDNNESAMCDLESVSLSSLHNGGSQVHESSYNVDPSLSNFLQLSLHSRQDPIFPNHKFIKNSTTCNISALGSTDFHRQYRLIQRNCRASQASILQHVLLACVLVYEVLRYPSGVRLGSSLLLLSRQKRQRRRSKFLFSFKTTKPYSILSVYRWLRSSSTSTQLPYLARHSLSRTRFMMLAYQCEFHPAASHAILALLLGIQCTQKSTHTHCGTGQDPLISSNPNVRMYLETRMGTACSCKSTKQELSNPSQTSNSSNSGYFTAGNDQHKPKTSKLYFPHKPRFSHPLVSHEQWKLPPKNGTITHNEALELLFVQKIEAIFKERTESWQLNVDKARHILTKWIERHNCKNFCMYQASDIMYDVYGKDLDSSIRTHVPQYLIKEYVNIGTQEDDNSVLNHSTSILRSVLAWHAAFDRLLPSSISPVVQHEQGSLQSSPHFSSRSRTFSYSSSNNNNDHASIQNKHDDCSLECGFNLDGRYILQKKLGHGAFAKVWLAQDDRTDELVAIKFTKSLPVNLAHSFIEIRHLNTISFLWPYAPIVGMRESRLFQDQIALVMDSHQCTLLDFHTSVSFSSLSPRLVGVVVAPILVALHALASTPCFKADGSLSSYKGIIHCDLKPENILVRKANLLHYYNNLSGEVCPKSALNNDFAIALSMVPMHRAYLSEKSCLYCPLCGRDRSGKLVFDVFTGQSIVDDQASSFSPNNEPVLLGGSNETQQKPLTPCEFVALSPVRLADQGSACASNEKVQTMVQTLLYRAPEVLMGTGFGASADMWSLGCVLAELVLGETLFPSTCVHEHAQFIEQRLGCMPANVLQHSIRLNDYERYDVNDVASGVGELYRDNAVDVYDLTGLGNGVGVETVATQRHAREKLGLLDTPCGVFETFYKNNEQVPFGVYRLKYAPEGPGQTIGELFMSCIDVNDPVDVMLYDLIVKMQILDPAKRITPLQAQQHPFFSAIHIRLPIMHSKVSEDGERLARHFCLQQRSYNAAMHTRLRSNLKYSDLVQYKCDEELSDEDELKKAYALKSNAAMSKYHVVDLPFSYRCPKQLTVLNNTTRIHQHPIYKSLRQPAEQQYPNNYPNPNYSNLQRNGSSMYPQQSPLKHQRFHSVGSSPFNNNLYRSNSASHVGSLDDGLSVSGSFSHATSNNFFGFKRHAPHQQIAPDFEQAVNNNSLQVVMAPPGNSSSSNYNIARLHTSTSNVSSSYEDSHMGASTYNSVLPHFNSNPIQSAVFSNNSNSSLLHNNNNHSNSFSNMSGMLRNSMDTRQSVDSTCESVMSIGSQQDDFTLVQPPNVSLFNTVNHHTNNHASHGLMVRVPLLVSTPRTNALTQEVSRFALASQPNSPTVVMRQSELPRNPYKLARRGESQRSSMDRGGVGTQNTAFRHHFSFDEGRNSGQYIHDSMFAVTRMQDDHLPFTRGEVSPSSDRTSGNYFQ